MFQSFFYFKQEYYGSTHPKNNFLIGDVTIDFLIKKLNPDTADL